MLGFENISIISTKFGFIHLIPATMKYTSFFVSEIIDCKFLDWAEKSFKTWVQYYQF